jgi:hypothetical protein
LSTLELDLDWCTVCCSQHGQFRACPGPVETSGPERIGRHFVADRPMGDEAYQILLAPAGELWQARIVTIPGISWRVPGCRGTVKFFDRSAIESERKAVLHILRHCRSNAIEIREIESPAPGAADDVPADPRTSGDRPSRPLTALFGHDVPTWPAKVATMSESELWLETARPAAEGARLRVALRFDRYRIPLDGVVVWSRRRPEGGRSPGMGIELDDPPFVYRELVASLTKAGKRRTDPAPTS